MSKHKIIGVHAYSGSKIAVDIIYNGQHYWTHSVYAFRPEMLWMDELSEGELSRVEIAEDGQRLRWPDADRNLAVEDVVRCSYASINRKWNQKRLRPFMREDLTNRTATTASKHVWRDPINWRNLDFHEDGTCRVMCIGPGTASESLNRYFWTFVDDILTVREVFPKPLLVPPEVTAALGMTRTEWPEMVHRYRARRFDGKCAEFERKGDWVGRVDYIDWWYTYKRPKSWT